MPTSRPHNNRPRGARCWAHDTCEQGHVICTDCPDHPDTCTHTTQEIAA